MSVTKLLKMHHARTGPLTCVCTTTANAQDVVLTCVHLVYPLAMLLRFESPCSVCSLCLALLFMLQQALRLHNALETGIRGGHVSIRQPISHKGARRAHLMTSLLCRAPMLLSCAALSMAGSGKQLHGCMGDPGCYIHALQPWRSSSMRTLRKGPLEPRNRRTTARRVPPWQSTGGV